MGNSTETAVLCRFADDGSDDFSGEAATPDLAGLFNRAKQHPILSAGRVGPGIHGSLDPQRYRHSAHVTALPNETCKHPVVLPKLEVLDGDRHHLGPP